MGLSCVIVSSRMLSLMICPDDNPAETRTSLKINRLPEAKTPSEYPKQLLYLALTTVVQILFHSFTTADRKGQFQNETAVFLRAVGKRFGWCGPSLTIVRLLFYCLLTKIKHNLPEFYLQEVTAPAWQNLPDYFALLRAFMFAMPEKRPGVPTPAIGLHFDIAGRGSGSHNPHKYS
jgi:hypothetical protein